MKLSSDAYAKAVAYLKTQGRPLEAKLFAYEFEGCAPDAAVTVLTAFQNPDGGFGHALEPDLRLADSSVIATCFAFSYFHALKLSGDHPSVAAACAYVNAQCRPDEIRWPITPPNVDDAPHAPWWDYGGDLTNSRANPTAEILGCLYEYPAHFSDSLRTEVAQAMTDYLVAQADKMDMFELHCYVRLVENPSVPAGLKTALMPKLMTLVSNTVQRDASTWRAYGLPPLALIPSPDSPFAPLFAVELPLNFDFMLNGQGADGGWHPNWNWGNQPEAWALAESDGTSILTLENLRKLRAFGMIPA